MTKTHLSEVDRYLLYWISAGSAGKRIFFLIKNLIILTKTFVMNFFVLNIKELFPLKPQVIINPLIVDAKDSFQCLLIRYLLFRVTAYNDLDVYIYMYF